MTTATRETLGFQTEVKQLLSLMIHSLYSNPEIFLRELISNSSDAVDKLRFEMLENPAWQDSTELKITVDFDKDAKTITISDNGIGMTRAQIIEHLGTIAKSGTREFLENLSGDSKKDNHLIGQFGVGFYSAFVVADKVTVISRHAGAGASEAVKWESTGEGDFTVDNVEKDTRGTDVILHVRETATEFLESWRLREVIRKYSDHVGLPIYMQKIEYASDDKEDEKEKANKVPEYEVVNKATALWTVAKKELKDEEYQAFYKHLAHDFEDALTWSHNRVEGKQQYINLLFIPGRAPFDMWNRDKPRGLKLYVQRVFIMDDAEQFLPMYLRFVKGVIDSSDLPLNVSREILQKSALVDSMRAGTVNKVLGMLEQLADKEPEKYQKFWQAFGSVLKEGPGEDFSNRERIAKLLRFASTLKDSEVQDVSLDEYIKRMKLDQDKIYYITAETFNAAKNSPLLEIFRKKGIEVLLLSDRVDEWLMSHLHEFEGKSFQSVAKGDLDLGKLEDEESKLAQEKTEKDFSEVITKVKEILGDKVQDVRITHRLTDSPSCIVAENSGMSLQLQRMLKEAGQAVPEAKPILELNPEHALVKRLQQPEQRYFADLCEILLDQAVLTEGGQLSDPTSFVKRLNGILQEIVA